MRRFLACILAVTLTLACSACASRHTEETTPQRSPTESIAETEQAADPLSDGQTHEKQIAAFSLKLLNEAHNGGNTFVSPLSVLYTLGMTANGAKGETLAQIEATLGLSNQELSEFLSSYYDYAASDEMRTVNIANSIWFIEDAALQIDDGYLQRNQGLHAESFHAPLAQETCTQINDWVSNHTDGMIPSMIDRIPDDTVALLVNAALFSSCWMDAYNENQVVDGMFTTEDGRQLPVQMLEQNERFYLEGHNCTGILKQYNHERYAFMALLPEEGVTVQQFLEELSAEDWLELLNGARNEHAHVVLPKFNVEFEVDLEQTLQRMGITDAFDDQKADLTGIGTVDGSSPHIGAAKHKTAITLDENGTSAAAASLFCIEWFSGAEHTVHFERPFVYMIVDTQAKLPLFLGVMTDPTVGS